MSALSTYCALSSAKQQFMNHVNSQDWSDCLPTHCTLRMAFYPTPPHPQGLQSLIMRMLSLKPDDRPSIEQIMADPTTANAVVNLYTDIGRLPYTRPKPPIASSSGGRRKSLMAGKGARQRSFFEDYWAEDEEVRSGLVCIHSNGFLELKGFGECVQTCCTGVFEAITVFLRCGTKCRTIS